MAKKQQLKNDHRLQIVNLKRQHVSNRNIAIQLDCSVRTVQRVWSRYRATGETKRATGSGRRKKGTHREDRGLVLSSRLSRFSTARQLTEQWNMHTLKDLSIKTARRRLHERLLYGRIARQKPLISVVNRKRRVSWCKRVKAWTVQENWRHIVFSDECRFVLSSDDRRVRCWRTAGEACDPSLLNFRTRNNISIMVWGCMSVHGLGELIVVDGNMDHRKYIGVLEKCLLPSIPNMFGDRCHPFIFQDDNAPCHRPRAVDDWLEDHNIRRVMWPAQSPGANIIENVWNDMSKMVLMDRPTSKQSLLKSVFRARESISTARIQQLYDSLPRRVAAIIRCR